MVAVQVRLVLLEADAAVEAVGRLAAGRLVRLTFFAPRRRASSIAARLSTSPIAAAARVLVDDDVFDPRLQPGRDAVRTRASAADDPTIEPGHEQHRVGCRDDARPARSAVGGGDDDDSCGISRANASTSSSVTDLGTNDLDVHESLTLPAHGLASRTHVVGLRTTLSRLARRLGSVLEPVIGQVYFSPECHANYARSASTRARGAAGGVALPDGPAYFTSRGWVMGQVAGEVVAAAFGVFNPEVVVPLVELGWTRTDAATICAGARRRRHRPAATDPRRRAGGCRPRSTSCCSRAVEPLRPEGRPLYAGLRSLGDARRRRSARCGVWATCSASSAATRTSRPGSSAGLDATEIGLLSELYWGLPMRSYARTRAWTEAQFDAAHDRLKSRGLIDDDGFTDAGREFREDDRGAHRRADAAGDRRARRRRRRAVLAPRAVGRRRPRRPRLPLVGPHDLADAPDRPSADATCG